MPATFSPRRDSFSFNLISSHRGFSLQLFQSHPIAINYTLRQLIASHAFSYLPSSSQLFSVDLRCPHRVSCHLNFFHVFSAHLNSSLLSSSQLLPCTLFTALLMSGRLNSSHLSLSSSSQPVYGFLNSSQLMQAHLMPSHLVSPLLTSHQRKAPKMGKSSQTHRCNFGAAIPMRFASSKPHKTMGLGAP